MGFRIVKPICGQKSQEENRAQKRNATASVRAQRRKSRAQKRKSRTQKSGREKKSNRRITLTAVCVCVCVESTVEFTVDPFDFQSTKVVHLGFLKVLLGVLFLRDIFKCSAYKEHFLSTC